MCSVFIEEKLDEKIQKGAVEKLSDHVSDDLAPDDASFRIHGEKVLIFMNDSVQKGRQPRR